MNLREEMAEIKGRGREGREEMKMMKRIGHIGWVEESEFGSEICKVKLKWKERREEEEMEIFV